MPSRAPRRTLSESECNEAINAYRAGDSLTTIASRYGCAHPTVARALERRGVSRRPRCRVADGRSDLFEQQLARDELYWLGLLWADGWLRGNRLCLALHYTDGEHVAAFGRFAGLNRTPRRYRDQVRVDVRNDRVAARLIALGMTRNPRTPTTELMVSADFWRGMIDGDGSVLLYGGRPILRLNGYPALTGGFLDFARACGAVTQATPRPHASITRAQLSGPSAVHMIRILYGDARIALPRKLTTAREVLAQ